MTNITNINIRELSKLPSPEFYQKKYPSSDQQNSLVIDSRKTIENIIEGKDSRLLLLVGPCSIHDTKAGIEYAEKLKELADKVSENIYVVMRVYFEKPRTTVGWKGLSTIQI